MSNLIPIIEKEFLNFSIIKNTTEQGKIFLKWFLKNIESDLISNDDLDDCLIGCKNDCGIDAYYYEEVDKTLRLYQGKYKNSGGDLTDKEKLDGITLIEYLSNQKSKNRWVETRKDLLDQGLVSNLEECEKIVFVYVTTCSEIKMNEFRNKLEEVIKESDLIQEVIVYSESGIERKLNNEVKPVIASFISQKGKYNKFDYETSDGKYKAYIMNISGDDLVKLSKQEYFNENIRFGIGNSKINKNITNTVNNDPELFWFFNNGITIICNEVKENAQSFMLKGAQVVNGAQTIHSLSKASVEKRKSVSVLVKILELGNENDILDNIVRYNNSQNKIDGW